MASMGTLTTVAKQRPQFMSTVVQAFETLHGKLKFLAARIVFRRDVCRNFLRRGTKMTF